MNAAEIIRQHTLKLANDRAVQLKSLEPRAWFGETKAPEVVTMKEPVKVSTAVKEPKVVKVKVPKEPKPPKEPKVKVPKEPKPPKEPKVKVPKEPKPPKEKRKAIPKHIKTLVWNKYIGADIASADCMSCRTVKISNRSFHCGHVIAESKGGDMTINNLRPICEACNGSMGTKSMNEFTKEFFGWVV